MNAANPFFQAIFRRRAAYDDDFAQSDFRGTLCRRRGGRHAAPSLNHFVRRRWGRVTQTARLSRPLPHGCRPWTVTSATLPSRLGVLKRRFIFIALEREQLRSLGDLVADAHRHVDHHSAIGAPTLLDIRGSAFGRCPPRPFATCLERSLPLLAVEFEEDVTVPVGLRIAYRQQFHDQFLTFFDLDRHFFAQLRSVEEDRSRQDAQVAVALLLGRKSL